MFRIQIIIFFCLLKHDRRRIYRGKSRKIIYLTGELNIIYLSNSNKYSIRKNIRLNERKIIFSPRVK